MDAAFAVAVTLALLFAFTNGILDAANAIATLVATRAATPLQAVVLAAIFNMLGPLVLGAAVADTIGGIVTLEGSEGVDVIAAGLFAAVSWNALVWFVGVPSSSGHALIGGLVGAALVAGGVDAVQWGGLDGWHPVGAFGTLIALALAPLLGGLAALAAVRTLRRSGRRATRRLAGSARFGEWGMTAALALSHGANDAQKTVGVIAALLVADGRTSDTSAPVWAVVACSLALTLGTALGGWRIVETVGRRIFRLRHVDGLASQSGSAAVIFGASMLGAPVSTTQVVASSVVGVAGGRRRWHHVRWAVVREMGMAWVFTIPATAALAAVTMLVWQRLE